MIPKKIQPYFKITQITQNRDNRIIEGVLKCCDAHDFEIFVVGRLKYSFFSKMALFPDAGNTIFEVRCKKCGNVISVFNSNFDGYGQCGKVTQNIYVSPWLIDCIKCRSNSFSVTVKYEYPDIQELKELELGEIYNAFTWIWITLECNKCGAKYKKFVDYETT